MSATRAVDRVIEALHAAGSSQRYGGNWNCPGTGHPDGDRNPSLHLTSNGKGVAVTCHRGCDTKEIVEILGLEMSDLFDEPIERREVARYPYLDESGEVLFAKVRMEPKDFRIRHPNGNGEWVSGLGDIRRVIYNLPSVLKAVESGQRIFVCEGEKDCDRLTELGEVATCNFEGAGTGKPKWRREYSEWLSGALQVIVVADRDDAGVAHARAISEALKGKVGDCRIVQSKTTHPGDDVSDHILAGYSLDELVPLRAENDISRKYTPVNWREVWTTEPPPIEWLIEPVLERGTINALFSKPGVGKSLVTMEMALRIVRSGEVALLIDQENRVIDLVTRLHSFGATPEELDNLVVFNFAELPPLDTAEGARDMIALADAYKPALVVLDTTSRVVQGDENDSSTYLDLARLTLGPLKSRGICVLRLDHVGKDASRGQRGSSSKESFEDSLWSMTKDSEEFIVLERTKSRTGHGGSTVVLQKHDNPLRFDWDAIDSMVNGAVIAIAKQLDKYEVPLAWGRDRADKVLQEHNVGARHETVSAALKWRRDQAALSGTDGGQRDWSPSGKWSAGNVDEDGCPFL